MRKHTYLPFTLAIAGLFLAVAGFQSTTLAQDAAAPAAAPAAAAADPTASAVPETVTALTIEQVQAKWNKNLIWVSFIVNDGRLEAQRDYFGAFDKAAYDALISGSAKGMIRAQQVFYYNASTRQFSRFDATTGGAVAILGKNGYFTADSIVRLVPLNIEFVERLATQSFLNVEGVDE